MTQCEAASSRTSSASCPVLMYHQLLAGRRRRYDLTPDEFRAELQRLYDGPTGR